MPELGPIKRKDLIYYLRRAGFEGPYSGTKHQLMTNGSITVRIPNPHESDIGKSLLLEILKQAGISKEKWKSL